MSPSNYEASSNDQSTGKGNRAMLDYLSLFTSLGTLLCCALPSLLVLVGLGATVASVLSAVPALVTLSHHKNWVFTIAGLLIGGNFVYTYAIAPRLRARGAACSTETPEACDTASAVSRTVLWIAAAIYSIGVFSAYVLGPLLMRFAD
jgi:mercuric ion transport protein